MRPALLVPLVSLLAAFIGCTHAETLVGEGGHHRLIARDQPSGVTVVLTTAAWDAQPSELADQITVIHALVANMGDQPIVLAPGDLELRDDRGFRYNLLDVGAMFFAPSGATDPQAAYRRSIEGRYAIGRETEFQAIDASGDVHAQALPWGVLLPGTQMRGFIYFERIVRTANAGGLVWHFGTPEHKPVADLSFDLYVAR